MSDDDDSLSGIAAGVLMRRLVSEKALYLLKNPDGIHIYTRQPDETAWGDTEDIHWLLTAAWKRLNADHPEMADDLKELMEDYGWEFDEEIPL